MTSIRPLVLTLGVSISILSAAPGRTQEVSQDSDWPCDQALVPQIAAAVIWDGAPVEGLAWREVPPVADLVGRITPSTTTEPAAAAAIAVFAAGLRPPDQERMLTLVFAGVLEVLNLDRRQLIDGIKRYSRDQSRRAAALGQELDQLVRLEQDPDPSAAPRRDALKQRLVLEERVFDEREKSLPFLCTRPVAVEQRLGFLARTIAELIE